MMGAWRFVFLTRSTVDCPHLDAAHLASLMDAIHLLAVTIQLRHGHVPQQGPKVGRVRGVAFVEDGRNR